MILTPIPEPSAMEDQLTAASRVLIVAMRVRWSYNHQKKRGGESSSPPRLPKLGDSFGASGQAEGALQRKLKES